MINRLSVVGGRLSVVKLGGSLLDDTARRAIALRKIADRWNAGEEIVLVHGGGKHIDAALLRAGIPKRTHAGLRVTDDATLEVVVSVLAGHVNKMLVSELAALGVRAAGLSGCDGSTLVAEQHPPIDGVELGHVGRVTRANPGLLKAMLTQGVMPVLSSVGASTSGALFNINADTAAAAVASALRAPELRFLTDVAGLLDESGEVVPHLNTTELEAMLTSPAVSGGMKPKLQAALHALKSGVAQITIGLPTTDNRQPTTNGGTTLVAA
ncbi:MAG TPA: acetylglutamate kinase [Thermoanaerobaculia bacterium]|nr:acetylglutamate kinase [Thermoanaerobaculia bacterium]